MSLFCSICQKAFKSDKTFRMHLRSATHSSEESLFRRDPGRFRRGLTRKFTDHFVSFVSGLEDFLGADLAYQRYVAGNKYRIKGTLYASLRECVESIRDRITVKEDAGSIFIKKGDCSIRKRRMCLEDLKRPSR